MICKFHCCIFKTKIITYFLNIGEQTFTFLKMIKIIITKTFLAFNSTNMNHKIIFLKIILEFSLELLKFLAISINQVN